MREGGVSHSFTTKQKVKSVSHARSKNSLALVGYSSKPPLFSQTVPSSELASSFRSATERKRIQEHRRSSRESLEQSRVAEEPGGSGGW